MTTCTEKWLLTLLLLLMSLIVSNFVLSCFPRDVLDNTWDWIGLVPENFPNYSSILNCTAEWAAFIQVIILFETIYTSFYTSFLLFMLKKLKHHNRYMYINSRQSNRQYIKQPRRAKAEMSPWNGQEWNYWRALLVCGRPTLALSSAFVH